MFKKFIDFVREIYGTKKDILLHERNLLVMKKNT